MLSEKEKMLAGQPYDPLDPELVGARELARDLCQALNATREGHQEERRRILIDLFGEAGRHARSAVGVAELPRNAPVEIEMIVAVKGHSKDDHA